MSEPQHSPDDFAAEFEAAFACLQVTILEACGRERDWVRKIAAATRTGLEFAAANPPAAHVLTSEAFARGVEGVERYERLLDYLGERLRPGRQERPHGVRLPDITERAMAGGLLALVSQRIDNGKADELAALAPEAIQFVLTPYLGGEEARRVASQFHPSGSEQG
jgi:hypothetical protein